MKLKVIIKSVYGKDAVYPACEISKKFLEALGYKVFTPDTIEAAKALGYSFEQITEIKEI